MIFSCSQQTRFKKIESDASGVHFANSVESSVDLNIFNYLYFYNGAGVATGDLNSDGLPDLIFTSNQGANTLYINQGNFKFLDISDRIREPDRPHKWTTGVSMVDINGDGSLDIYINEVGSYLKIEGENKLWVNQGNDENGYPIFEEQAKKYHLDVVGFCTQSAFFDYDLDNDLDLYVLNHSVHSNGTFGKSTKRLESHPLAGDRFFENRNGVFVDVTAESGIYNSPLGYGLGITVSDINDDGYPDVYVGNDFHEDDYLYINQRNGTFKEALGDMINHTSRFSMGNDIGDFNNDGLLDILSLDMLPREYEKLKSSAGEDAYDIYNFKLNFGYKHQHARNTLQLNRGDGHFSEIGLLSGISATDWSWSGLMADFDLDGYSDIFVANGILGRTNDMDYINYVSNDAIQYRLEGDLGSDELRLSDKMPAVKIPNYAFRNNHHLLFDDVSKEWGLDDNTFSNGAVYADFDGDGDLDLAINNIGQEASIYSNQTLENDPSQHFIKFKILGLGENVFGVGTKITIQLNDTTILTREQFPVRGFESSVDYILHAGVGSNNTIPKVRAVYPGGLMIEMNEVQADQILILDFAKATTKFYSMPDEKSPMFSEDTLMSKSVDFKHEENDFVEFNREALIPHMISAEGPAVAVGDINNDGLDDILFGGAKHQHSILFTQISDFKFRKDTLEGDPTYEDVDADFQDINGDGFLDLLVACGGNEFRGKSKYLKPRVYINDQKGGLVQDSVWMPEIYLNASVLACADFDQDGDIDVFIGARSIPWNYGMPPKSYLLENTGKALKIMDGEFGNYMSNLGMVTEATWKDMDGDGRQDLVVASEWSTIKILYQESEGVRNYEIPGSEGLWSAMTITDIDQDNKPDIIAGNLGLNSKLSQWGNGALNMYVSDFDKNETIEQILTIEIDGDERIFADKMELSKQMVSLKKKFPDFKSFSQAKFSEIISPDLTKKSIKYTVTDTRSSVFFQSKDGSGFVSSTLPVQAQLSPVQAIIVSDFNFDGRKDILTAGNFAYANIQRGVYDASYGELFLQGENGDWEYMDQSETGFFLKGNIKELSYVKSERDSLLMIPKNDGDVLFYRLNDKKNSLAQ